MSINWMTRCFLCDGREKPTRRVKVKKTYFRLCSECKILPNWRVLVEDKWQKKLAAFQEKHKHT